MDAFPLEIVTPDAVPFSQSVVFLDVPAARGRLTILAHHEPILVLLKAGMVRIKPAEPPAEAPLEQKWCIEEGILRVEREKVTLLTTRAQRSN